MPSVLRCGSLATRLIFRCLPLLVAVLCLGAIPNIGLRGISSCEAAADQAESSPAVLVRSQSRSQLPGHRPRWRVPLIAPQHPTDLIVRRVDRAAPRGHRFANHLLAPLRL